MSEDDSSDASSDGKYISMKKRIFIVPRLSEGNIFVDLFICCFVRPAWG